MVKWARELANTSRWLMQWAEAAAEASGSAESLAPFQVPRQHVADYESDEARVDL